APVVAVEVVDRGDDAAALLLEPRAEALAVDAHLAASASRRSASSAATPSIATSLSRPPWPATIATDSRGSASAPASRPTTASFARPPSGRDETRTFQASPWRPTTS